MFSITYDNIRRKSVILLDNGLSLSKMFSSFLRDKEVIHAQSIEDAINRSIETSSDTIICSLILSHSKVKSQCLRNIDVLSTRFRNIIFVDPSVYRESYLEGLGLKNFHSGFICNEFMKNINLDFLLENSRAYAITHFGCNPAFDSEAPWIVPLDYPQESFPLQRAVAQKVEFEFPVYEFSCFLYAAFDSGHLSLDEDLYFIEKKILKSALQVSGLDQNSSILLRNAGLQVYVTGSDASQIPYTRDMAQFARRAHVDWSGRTADMVETKWVNDMIPAPFEMTVNELRNCIVTGTGAVTAEGRLVAESSYLLHLMYGRNAIRDGMRQPHHVGHIDGLAILAINSVSFNYYHWLAQIMPFMEIARNIVQQRGDKKITIVTGRTLRFHDEFIKILFEEFENVTVIRLRTGEFVTADSGLYSNVMSDGSPRCIVAEQLYVGQRLKAAFLDRISPASRFLYISRTDTNARRIANEDDLIGYVRARKFEVLTLSQMPVRDQISAFSEARIILGGHGAGMANILFASSQAHLVELQHSTYVNTCMLRLAQNVGAEHTVKFFFPDESRPSVGGEWDVDLAEIGRLLDRIMP